MANEVIIKSTNGQGKLVFSNASFNENNNLAGFDVALHVPGASGKTNVYAYAPHGHVLSNFFADIADNWRGWLGVKEYCSLESDLEINATSDSTGHVRLEITLRSNTYFWHIGGAIELDASQLDIINEELKVFTKKSAAS